MTLKLYCGPQPSQVFSFCGTSFMTKKDFQQRNLTIAPLKELAKRGRESEREGVTDRSHCDLDVSRGKLSVIGDSLYRTEAHTVL